MSVRLQNLVSDIQFLLKTYKASISITNVDSFGGECFQVTFHPVFDDENFHQKISDEEKYNLTSNTFLYK